MQQQVADQLGVHIESVKNWERGVHTPSQAVTAKIVEFLGYAPCDVPTRR
jgi:DNA-binding transcriptional regulator YiaG